MRAILEYERLSLQPVPAVSPAPLHSKGEAREPDCSLKHLIGECNQEGSQMKAGKVGHMANSNNMGRGGSYTNADMEHPDAVNNHYR